jgi:hypothetical protein
MLTPSPNGPRWPETQPLANPGRFTGRSLNRTVGPAARAELPRTTAGDAHSRTMWCRAPGRSRLASVTPRRSCRLPGTGGDLQSLRCRVSGPVGPVGVIVRARRAERARRVLRAPRCRPGRSTAASLRPRRPLRTLDPGDELLGCPDEHVERLLQHFSASASVGIEANIGALRRVHASLRSSSTWSRRHTAGNVIVRRTCRPRRSGRRSTRGCRDQRAPAA